MFIVIKLQVFEYPWKHFSSLRLCKTGFYQTLQPWPGVAYNTPNRTKANHLKSILDQRSPPRSWKVWGEAHCFRLSKVYANAASSFPSITPGTQRVTHILGRQGKQVLLIVRQYLWKLAGEMLLSRCSSGRCSSGRCSWQDAPPGFSRSNLQTI